MCYQCYANQVWERLDNNPEERNYINIVLENVNNNNESQDENDTDNDNDSNQDAADWEDIELFDIPQDHYDPDDDDDHDGEPDDGDPLSRLSELEKEIVNDFRSVVVQDNPISHYKVRILLSIIKRMCVFKFPSYNSLFKPKYKVEIIENTYNPTNAPGSLIECRYVFILFKKKTLKCSNYHFDQFLVYCFLRQLKNNIISEATL